MDRWVVGRWIDGRKDGCVVDAALAVVLLLCTYVVHLLWRGVLLHFRETLL